MSVRGSKNKIIIYIAGACSIAFAILLYHNASQRLEAMEISYERCHLNEESLSAQLQVNLEYKVRLEKSLQQEKSDHAQTKEELQNKIEDERQTRGRESLEATNKFTALQQQYKFLQSEHEIVSLELNKLRQLRVSEIEDKKHAEELVQNLQRELDNLKVNNKKLEKSNSLLLLKNRKIEEKAEALEKLNDQMKMSSSPGKLPSHPLGVNNEESGGGLRVAPSPRGGVLPSLNATKSSTTPNKFDGEFYPSANNFLANTSTPMINPQAVQDDDKIPVAPVPQPRQKSSSMRDQNIYDKNENVGPKPEKMNRVAEALAPGQGLFRTPDIFHQFHHIPQIRDYKKQLKEAERNNHGGEVGDEGEPMVKNNYPLREGDFPEQVRHPAVKEIPKNAEYQYQPEDEGRKEEEDDDDMDQLDYHNPNEKNNRKENKLNPILIQMPFADKHDGAMLRPK